MNPIRIILKAAKGPSGEYMSSWTLLPPRDETHAPSALGGTPLSVARRESTVADRAAAFSTSAMNHLSGIRGDARALLAG